MVFVRPTYLGTGRMDPSGTTPLPLRRGLRVKLQRLLRLKEEWIWKDTKKRVRPIDRPIQGKKPKIRVETQVSEDMAGTTHVEDPNITFNPVKVEDADSLHTELELKAEAAPEALIYIMKKKLSGTVILT